MSAADGRADPSDAAGDLADAGGIVARELDDEVRKGQARVRAVAIRTTDVSRNLDLFLAFAVARTCSPGNT